MGTNSPNIGLNIPTPNDPAVANVWPSLWNTNATIIDAAVAGLLPLDVSGAANVVLTFTNGSPSQSDNAIFVFSGTLTGNIDVLLPNGKSKLFMVKNSTTGAFALSMGANSTGSPGTPAGSVVAVPQGTTGMFYSDGTNVSSAFPTTFVSPTITGTATMPDLGTWSPSGIRGLTGLGIGFNGSLATIVDVRDNLNNGPTLSRVQNSDGGNNVSVRYRADNGSSIGDVVLWGVGFASSGINRADGLSILSNGGGGTTIGTSGAARPVYVAVDDAEVARFGSDGSFLVGSTLNAGAGSIGATGTITQAYSDMRLKTKLGSVRGAIAKVMSLDVFYYRRNRKAAALGFKGKRDVGLSAQQVQKILPEAVAPSPRNHDYLTIRYEKMAVLALAAIQEQQGQIEALKREVAALKRSRK